jgi:hypothetical protein
LPAVQREHRSLTGRFRPSARAVAGCAALAASAGLVACGSATSSGHGTTGAKAAAVAAQRRAASTSVALHYRSLGSLPALTQDAAGAPAPGGLSILAGGLSAVDRSTDEVWAMNGAHLVHAGHLPGPQHDAAAAAIGGHVYVFGGADFNQYDHVLRVDPAGTVTSAGRLPSLASDVAVAGSGDTGYVVGGYDGSQALSIVVAFQPGATAHAIARLPVALRYAAVAVAGGRLIVAGGSTPSGASRDVYALNLAGGGAPVRIGRLPHPLTHAAAGVLGSTVYVIGGRGDALGTPTASILAIDPASGRVRSAGRLPRALSDLTAVSQPGAIELFGGRTATATVGSVGRLSATG